VACYERSVTLNSEETTLTRKIGALPFAAFWLLAAGWLVGCATPPAAPAPTAADRLIFAETNDFWTAPTLLASTLGLYRQAGVDVQVAKFQSGLAAKNAVLARGADVGLVATTPLAIAGFQHESLALFVTYFESSSIVKLTGRGNAVSPASLPGHRIGYIPGTISEITLERLLAKYKITPAAVTRASFHPPELIPALRRGDIDAFVAWEPLPLQARQAIPGSSEFVDRDLYTVQLHLVTRPDVIAAKRGALVKLLVAVHLAEERIAVDPAGSRALIERVLGFQPGDLAAMWPDLHYMLKLDKPVVLSSLAAEGSWALRSGEVRGQLPDYTYMLRGDVLAAYQAGVQ
jgi:NitT/TauT family transport system substrate-binding protein